MNDDHHKNRPTDSEIGAALRSGDEELSPGFYTRARARFEQGGKPSRRRRFRLVSWELAGVVATVALAAVLFLPSLTRQELVSPVLPASDVVAELASEPAAVEENVAQRRDAPEEKRKASSELTRVGLAQDEGGVPLAPPPAPARAPAPRAAAAADAYGLAEQESLADSAEILIVPLATAQIALLLPQAALPPEKIELYEITDPEPWSVMMEGNAGIALAPLGPVRPFVRLVLVVAPTPVNCAISRIVSAGDRIDFALAPGLREETTGCAAVLPADSRPIAVRIVRDE